MNRRCCASLVVTLCLVLASASAPSCGSELPIVETEGQPLAANIERLIEALRYLGRPLPDALTQQLTDAGRARDAARLQELLDSQVLLLLSINPEARLKVQRGPVAAELQQAGYTPALIKIHNASTVTGRLQITSPQSGPVYAGVAELSMRRQQQERLRVDENVQGRTDRFLDLEMFTAPPMTERLSGLEVEYAIALIYSSEAGKREATLGFDIQQGSQDLGFRGETAVLFDVRPAIAVQLKIHDESGKPSIARLTFRDALGHVFPPQPKRLAPDLFFQPHIYRFDGESVLLPPGKFSLEYCRGPEYRVLRREVEIDTEHNTLGLSLERWIDPAAYGFYSGDHHIHAAGCAHYTSPTEGVHPEDMFRQVKGEGLNVGCVLTWGPCYSFQRQFFAPTPNQLSDDDTLIKYDLEISGFGSQALGHVCLLNLRDQTYPGSEGTSTKGWPTWTTPVMRWAKEQGGVTGYAHSASGLHIDPKSAAQRLLRQRDRNGDGMLDTTETDGALLPEPFTVIDADSDERLSLRELEFSVDRAADQLPNYAIPEMNGVGAMEISVSTAEGVCDFISAMDTARIQEWNTWYHLLNCGFPLKVSGETDFPCMSGSRVGQGRVYVRLGPVQQLNFEQWCLGLAAGRSYVSDGFAHALKFTVNDVSPGPEPVRLAAPQKVHIATTVAFAPEVPKAVAHGVITPVGGKRLVGDTVLIHGERSEEWAEGGMRLVELIVNGHVMASHQVPADGRMHNLEWTMPLERSSWVALRQFPQLHTNPVTVLVDDQPVRVSRASAQWCIDTIELLWENRRGRIAEHEREEAEATFQRALETFRTRQAETPDAQGVITNDE